MVRYKGGRLVLAVLTVGMDCYARVGGTASTLAANGTCNGEPFCGRNHFCCKKSRTRALLCRRISVIFVLQATRSRKAGGWISVSLLSYIICSLNLQFGGVLPLFMVGIYTYVPHERHDETHS